MNELFNNLLAEFHKNQFLAGGFVLAMLASLAAAGRQLFMQARAWAWRNLTCEMEVSNFDDFFELFSIWMANNPHLLKVRHVEPRTTYMRSSGPSGPDYFLRPAPGTYVVPIKGIRTIFRIHRDSPTSSLNSNSNKPMMPIERITITAFTRDRNFLMDFMKEIQEEAEKFTSDKTYTYVFDGGWDRMGETRPRSLESVCLPDADIKTVIDAIEKYKSSEALYRRRGIPYRLGMLFHGDPGTGKTSLIVALANHYKMNLYTMSLASSTVSDSSLPTVLRNVKDNSIVLFEDVDCLFRQREEDERVGVTFSGYLNALDGVATRENVIFVQTTNHKELLDPALFRPGRVDIELEFTYATSEQAKKMLVHFYPEATEDEQETFAMVMPDSVTTAEIQKHLLATSNIDEAIQNDFSGKEPEVPNLTSEQLKRSLELAKHLTDKKYGTGIARGLTGGFGKPAVAYPTGKGIGKVYG